MNPMLLTPEQAATELGISRSRFYELMGEGRIASVKIGRSRRIPRDALEAFVASLTRTAVSN